MNSASTWAGAVLEAHGLRKVFPGPAGELVVLDGMELEVRLGELLGIVGPSGAGKSTLLHLLAALDSPTSGTIRFDGRSLGELLPAELAQYRNRSLGFVWQLSNLLPDFTAAENVMLPRLCRGESSAAAHRQAEDLLAEIGLAARADHLAGELSGGEQQRVALARALVTRPRVLLADEPTGNLDQETAAAVFELVRKLHRTHALTSVIATHNLSLASVCDRVLRLEHGRLLPVPQRSPDSGEGRSRGR